MTIEIIIIAVSYILAGISNFVFFQYIMDDEFFAEINNVKKKSLCAGFATVWPVMDCMIIVAMIAVAISRMTEKKG